MTHIAPPPHLTPCRPAGHAPPLARLPRADHRGSAACGAAAVLRPTIPTLYPPVTTRTPTPPAPHPTTSPPRWTCAASCAVQIIVDLQSAVRDLLLQYYAANGKIKPKAILFYRDGVGEGQFDEVLGHEFMAIKVGRGMGQEVWGEVSVTSSWPSRWRGQQFNL
eukprot:364379-Chlamydomonas_euryale.AAC.1